MDMEVAVGCALESILPNETSSWLFRNCYGDSGSPLLSTTRAKPSSQTRIRKPDIVKDSLFALRISSVRLRSGRRPRDEPLTESMPMRKRISSPGSTTEGVCRIVSSNHFQPGSTSLQTLVSCVHCSESHPLSGEETIFLIRMASLIELQSAMVVGSRTCDERCWRSQMN